MHTKTKYLCVYVQYEDDFLLYLVDSFSIYLVE